MSNTNQNQLTKFYSGKFGKDFVFRHYYNGKSVLAKLPRPYNTTPTKKQAVVRRDFKFAVEYAKDCRTNPEKLALYGPTVKVGRSVYRQAMNDFLNPPEIERIEIRDYKGHKGETIRVVAIDDFRVKSVHLQIATADGILIEEGECVARNTKDVWEYTVTKDVPDVTGFVITASAYDYPGNKGEREASLPSQ